MTEVNGRSGDLVIPQKERRVREESKNSIKWPTLSRCFIEQSSAILVVLNTQRLDNGAAAAGRTTTLCRNRQQPPSNAIPTMRVRGIPYASQNCSSGEPLVGSRSETDTEP